MTLADDIPTTSVESSTPNAGTEVVSQPPPASGDEVNTDAPPVVEHIRSIRVENKRLLIVMNPNGNYV